jgi:hypothetical protein
MPQTALETASAMESRLERKPAPQNSQRLPRRNGLCFLNPGVFAETDAVFFLVVVILIVLFR